MFTKIISFIILLAIWFGLTGIHNDALLTIFGFCAVSLAFIIANWLKLLPSKNPFKINSLFYFCWLAKEIIMSSIAVIKISLRRNLGIQQILEPIKSMQTTNIGIVTYANSITLTPGTVTLSTEGDTILVHALDVKFMHDLQEGEMDNRVRRIIK